MFWPVLATVAIIYVCNATLAMRQMRNFSTTYTLLRKRGKVAIGKQKNALSRGAIVMFLLDDSDRVVAGRRMNGITVLARFRDFPVFDGLPVEEIDLQVCELIGERGAPSPTPVTTSSQSGPARSRSSPRPRL
ncbi:glucitol operon activator protein [Cutibacterium acnes JCM 18909]|nr:glucitol operon activator protein [Cutibacterium acnes JCM 18909]